MIYLKTGVSLKGIQPQIVLAVAIANEIYRSLGQELTITSCNDGQHMEGSLHYKGLAVDLRTKDIPPERLGLIYDKIKNALGPEYDVVLESNHLHIEYDVKG